MNKDEFWRIIDTARESASHWSSIPTLLADSLSKLDAAAILHWHGILTEYHALSYRNRLWDAAIVMLGSCSCTDVSGNREPWGFDVCGVLRL